MLLFKAVNTKKVAHAFAWAFFRPEGFEQGGSEAEENAPGEHFRRRGIVTEVLPVGEEAR